MSEPRGVVIGIDPGNAGGIVVMDLNGAVVDTYRMPVDKGNKTTVDLARLEKILQPPRQKHLVLVEEQHSRGGEGVAGMDSLMKAVGAIWGLCYAMRLPYEEVRPQAWQKIVPASKAKLPKSASKAERTKAQREWKVELVRAAKRRWPTADLIGSSHASAKDHSGIADALWIAEYARLRVVGVTTRQPMEAC